MLIASESIFTAVLSWLLLRERFKFMTGFALFLGMVGVYLIVERSLIPNIPSGGGALHILGDVLVILGLICEAFYTVRGKSLLVKHPPLLITSAAIVGSAIVWIPLAGGEVLYSGWHPLSVTAWLALGWLAIMSTVVAYLAWFRGLEKIDGQQRLLRSLYSHCLDSSGNNVIKRPDFAYHYYRWEFSSSSASI